MRSVISCFDPALLRKNLSRFWPLWAGYAGIWLIGFAGVYNSLTGYTRLSHLAEFIVTAGWMMGILAGSTMGIMAAMCVFSYLMNHRATQFFHALPYDRRTLFCTSVLSGLAVYMLPNLLFYVLGTVWCSLFTTASLWQSIQILTMWLLELTTQYLFYFGLATFCAMLTGHILMLPALYATFNFIVPMAEVLIRELCTRMIWGFHASSIQFSFLSPIWHTLQQGDMPDLNVKTGRLQFWLDPYHLAMAAVGLLLLGGAWLLYKNRQSESAGDVIAVSWLRPVFKYSVGILGAMPVGLLINLILTGDISTYDGGGAAFAFLCFSLLLGGAICYFAAAMLLDKSVRVWKNHYRGWVVQCCALMILLTGLQVDVLGLELYTPDPARVEHVRVIGFGSSLRGSEEAQVDLALQLHRALVQRKDSLTDLEAYYDELPYAVTLMGKTPTLVREDRINAYIPQEPDRHTVYVGVSTRQSYTIRFYYDLDNGYTVERRYRVQLDSSRKDEVYTLLQQLTDYNAAKNLGMDVADNRIVDMSLRFDLARGLYENKDRLIESAAHRRAILDALQLDYLAGNLTGAQDPVMRDLDYIRSVTGWELEYAIEVPEDKEPDITLPAVDVPTEEHQVAIGDSTVAQYHTAKLPLTAVNTLQTLQRLGYLTAEEYLVVIE